MSMNWTTPHAQKCFGEQIQKNLAMSFWTKEVERDPEVVTLGHRHKAELLN